MDTVFWDSQGVIYIDYLENGKTVTGLYYAELLSRFDAYLKKKRPTAKLVELDYEQLPHPPYFFRLGPCDFFLFPNYKKSLAGQKFKSNEEVITATEAYYATSRKYIFQTG